MYPSICYMAWDRFSHCVFIFFSLLRTAGWMWILYEIYLTLGCKQENIEFYHLVIISQRLLDEMSSILPFPGYLWSLRAQCNEHLIYKAPSPAPHADYLQTLRNDGRFLFKYLYIPLSLFFHFQLHQMYIPFAYDDGKWCYKWGKCTGTHPVCTEGKCPKAAGIKQCLGKMMKMEYISLSHRPFCFTSDRVNVNIIELITSNKKWAAVANETVTKDPVFTWVTGVFTLNAGGARWKKESEDKRVWAQCPPCVVTS